MPLKTLAKKSFLVGSGKGGVGKSTITANLAIALAEKGKRVGLLDADLYGPSMPLMMGLRNLSPKASKEGKVIPVQKFGVDILSIGFFLEETHAVVWRGPMLHNMLRKMVEEVAWPQLDYLFVDLPPGTGDVPLSLKQLIEIKGALLVTTPQAVAIADVLKAIHAYDQLQIPLFGLVENMSGPIFGEKKAQALADQFSLPLLASIPLEQRLCENGDNGIPSTPYFRDLADNFLKL